MSPRGNCASVRAALSRYEGRVRFEAHRLVLGSRYGQALDHEDLYAEGRIAVLEALERYQGYGVEEPLWVGTRIRQRMLDVLRRFDVLTREEQDFVAQRRRRCSDEDLERVRTLCARRIVSFDASACADVEPLSERVHDRRAARADEVLDRKMRERCVERAIGVLPVRQRMAVELALREGLQLRAIGERMGVTEAAVCRLQRCAVVRLRRALREHDVGRAARRRQRLPDSYEEAAE